MANPWDAPPFPKRGDADDNLTYTQVGRAMSNWEAVEFNLARLYSLLVGDPDGPSIRDYGAGRIFRDRLGILTRAIEGYFVRHPHQEGEGVFDSLVAMLVGFSDRRNEIAHGMVFLIDRLTLINQHLDPATRYDKQWALIPPYHTIRHHQPDGTPLYVYTSAELRHFADCFVWLNYAADMSRNALLPIEQRRPLIELAPPWL